MNLNSIYQLADSPFSPSFGHGPAVIGSAAISKNQALYDVFPPEDWVYLADKVSAYSPDVVILVARKMPRIVELLSLNFGSQAIVVCDYAIPFIHKLLKKAAVAIVDDYINIGTTIVDVRKKVTACDPREIRTFAIAKKKQPTPLEGIGEDYREGLVYKDDIEQPEYFDRVQKIPLALGFLSKPYDIEFPIIDCAYTLPFTDSDEMFLWLQQRYSKHVHRHDRPYAKDHGLARITVDLEPDLGLNFKFRLYMDNEKHTCRVIPFALNYATERKTPFMPLRKGLFEQLESAPSDSKRDNEQKFRVNQFFDSLNFFFDKFGDLAEILTIANEKTLFSIDDAQYLFGPDFNQSVEQLFPEGVGNLEEIVGTQDSSPEELNTPSPFWVKAFKNDGFKEKFRVAVEDVTVFKSAFDYFAAFFTVLSEKTGAENHKQYSMEWPYPEEIEKDPYLRLRVGPTFQDLVAIMDWLCGGRYTINELRSIISSFLDKAIDDGGVVPCIADYEGKCYRIYRKGEVNTENEPHALVEYALDVLEKAKIKMTPTRFAKILATLSFTELGKGRLVPVSLERGNAAAFPDTVLDQGQEITLALGMRTPKKKAPS